MRGTVGLAALLDLGRVDDGEGPANDVMAGPSPAAIDLSGRACRGW